MLAGTRGIEPPFSPLAALTSNEWLALWYTRSRRAFPCNARLSGLPNGDNCLLIDRYNRNDAMQLVGLRSGLPKTHPSVQCRAAICTTRVWESNPHAWESNPASYRHGSKPSPCVHGALVRRAGVEPAEAGKAALPPSRAPHVAGLSRPSSVAAEYRT